MVNFDLDTSELFVTLEKALNDKSQEGNFYLYRLDIGGEIYIGFTSQMPEKRLEQHLESARSGSKNLVHKKLREFGYYHKFEVIAEYSHEVEALINEIIFIKKYNAKLNLSEGGEGKKYKVVRTKNELGESILNVLLVEKYKEHLRKKEELEVQKKKEELESNGSVLTDFILKLVKDNPLDFDPYVNKQSLEYDILKNDSNNMNYRNILLAEVYKEYSKNSPYNIPHIYFRNICHFFHLENAYGRDYGFDKSDFKKHLEIVYAAIMSPSSYLESKVREKMFFKENKLYRGLHANKKSITLELNNFNTTISGEFTKVYEDLSTYGEEGYFDETPDLHKSCFYKPYFKDYPDLTEDEFISESKKQYLKVKSGLKNLNAEITKLYCFGTYRTSKKGLFSIGKELRDFHISFDIN